MPTQLGLLGNQIAYSLSPKIHRYSFSQLAIDAEYNLYDIAEDQVHLFLDDFLANGGVGLNVTKPYKGVVAQILGAAISSCNTVFLEEGHTAWKCTSTDAEGFCRGLEHMSVSINDFSRIVTIGAGGAVLALLEHFNNELTLDAELTVLARRPGQIKGSHRSYRIDSLSEAALTNAISGSRSRDTLLIQGTSAPLSGENLSYLLPSLEGFEGAFVDLVYGTPSALFDFCRSQELPTQDGLPMLIEQARLSQEVWFGRSAPYSGIATMLKDDQVDDSTHP